MQVPCVVGEVSKNCIDITPPDFTLYFFQLVTGTTSSGDGKATPLGDAYKIKGQKGKSDLLLILPPLLLYHTVLLSS